MRAQPRPRPVRTFRERRGSWSGAPCLCCSRRAHAPALRVDPDLARIAREYSCALLARGALSHTGADGTTVSDRIRAAGKTFLAVGENLASSTDPREPVEAAIEAWMKSPGHRENILRPDFTDTGVGVCHDGTTYYFTQLFLRPGRAR